MYRKYERSKINELEIFYMFKNRFFIIKKWILKNSFISYQLQKFLHEIFAFCFMYELFKIERQLNALE